MVGVCGTLSIIPRDVPGAVKFLNTSVPTGNVTMICTCIIAHTCTYALNVLIHKPHALMGCAQNVDKTVHRVQKAKNVVLIKTAYLRANYVQSRASLVRYTAKMRKCVVTNTRTVNVVQP